MLTDKLSQKPRDITAEYLVLINRNFKLPSRFRRKKGYTGPTASKYNQNWKKMPSDF